MLAPLSLWSNEKEGTMNVTAAVLNVRSGPGTDFRVLSQLRQGDLVEIAETRGDWVWVGPGWVSRAFLATPAVLNVPRGLAAITAMFGQPGALAASSGRAVLPAPLKLGWSSAEVTRFACHALLEDSFTRVFHTIHARGLWPAIRTFDGCYNARKIGSTGKWSTHAWGIAVDLNSATNRQGSAGNMPQSIIRIFEEEGFYWGGRWSGAARDPMHFQFAEGY
jgi:hypothetical protein